MYGGPFKGTDLGTVIDLFASDFILVRIILWNLFIFHIMILNCKQVFFFTRIHIRVVLAVILFRLGVVEHRQCIKACLVLDWN